MNGNGDFRKAHTQTIVDAVEEGDWSLVNFSASKEELLVTMYNSKGYVDFYVCTDHTDDQIRSLHQAMIKGANDCLKNSHLQEK